MSKYVQCINCNNTYKPTGLRGSMYCTTCGAAVYPVLSESDSDSDEPINEMIVEVPLAVEIIVESPIITEKPAEKKA